jgi:hypothetical protein
MICGCWEEASPGWVHRRRVERRNAVVLDGEVRSWPVEVVRLTEDERRPLHGTASRTQSPMHSVQRSGWVGSLFALRHATSNCEVVAVQQRAGTLDLPNTGDILQNTNYEPRSRNGVRFGPCL